MTQQTCRQVTGEVLVGCTASHAMTSLMRRIPICGVVCIVICHAWFAWAAHCYAVDADLLLQGGTIFDGTGSDGTIGDVAIRGERIAAVGRVDADKVGRVIDCRGLIVAPGFIDLHTHSDRTVVQPALRNTLNYLTQGCTTSVTGNCGLGPNKTAEYLNRIDHDGAGTNVIHLIPHGPLRRAGMGNAKRPANAEEIQRMKALIDKAMQAGAWGMSTGLIYQWSCYADTDELVALAKAVGAHGGIYASHIRSEADHLVEAVAEAIEIGRRAGVPVHISHFKVMGVPNWGNIRKAVELIEEARRNGQKVTADQYPYIASFTSSAATLFPETQIPGGRANLFKRMEADPRFAEKVREVIKGRLVRSRKIVVMSCKNPEWKGRSLADIAAELNIDRVDLALKLHKMGGGSAVNFAMCEEDVRYVMNVPWVATASDGWGHVAGAGVHCHPRNFGTFPRKIGHYAISEKVIPLARAIRSATGLPAEILGLSDRGHLRKDAHADIVVFDPKTFIDRATFEKPAVYSTGVSYLFIAGNPAIDDGKPSKKLYGRSIRHRPK